MPACIWLKYGFDFKIDMTKAWLGSLEKLHDWKDFTYVTI